MKTIKKILFKDLPKEDRFSLSLLYIALIVGIIFIIIGIHYILYEPTVFELRYGFQ